MSAESTAAAAAAGTPVEPKNYLNCETGIKSWLLTRDHKRIGLMFLACVTVALFLGGLFAMLIRIELLTPDETIMSAQTYNRMFTLHGVVMIFLFMIPAIPGVFGNFCLPLMLGAQDVAFPKLNLLSLYLYWTGAIIATAGRSKSPVRPSWNASSRPSKGWKPAAGSTLTR